MTVAGKINGGMSTIAQTVGAGAEVAFDGTTEHEFATANPAECTASYR